MTDELNTQELLDSLQTESEPQGTPITFSNEPIEPIKQPEVLELQPEVKDTYPRYIETLFYLLVSNIKQELVDEEDVLRIARAFMYEGDARSVSVIWGKYRNEEIFKPSKMELMYASKKANIGIHRIYSLTRIAPKEQQDLLQRTVMEGKTFGDYLKDSKVTEEELRLMIRFLEGLQKFLTMPIRPVLVKLHF